MSPLPASEIVAAGVADLMDGWITQAFGARGAFPTEVPGVGTAVTRDAGADLSTLEPEQTPAIRLIQVSRSLREDDDNVPYAFARTAFTVQATVRRAQDSADSPVATLMNLLVDALDALWATAIVRGTPVAFFSSGNAVMTYPGKDHANVEFNFEVEYPRLVGAELGG